MCFVVEQTDEIKPTAHKVFHIFLQTDVLFILENLMPATSSGSSLKVAFSKLNFLL